MSEVTQVLIDDVEVIAPAGDPPIQITVSEQGPPGQAGGAVSNNILYGTRDPLNSDGQNGYFWVNTATNFWFGPKAANAWPAGISLVGPQGLQGVPGQDGIDGAAGIPGTNGTNGANGADGADGASAYEVAVANGFVGNQAAWLASLVGAKGDKGDKGDQGLQGLKGDQGDQGIQGLQGIQGIQGVPGNDGADGSNGTNGVDGKTIIYGAGAPDNGTGNNGDTYINTTTNYIYGPKAAGAWPAGTSLVGPQGIQGIQGDTGATGPAGSDAITSADPTTPSAGTIALARRKTAHKEYPGYKNSDGKVIGLQDYMGGRRVGLITTGNISSTTFSGIGMATNNVEGTAAHPVPDVTNAVTRTNRITYTSATSNNASCGWREGANRDYIASGFLYEFIFGFEDAAGVTNSRSFIGLCNTNTSGFWGADPSGKTNIIGFGHDTGDANLQFIHNDASGVATKHDLGSSFSANSTDQVYKASMWIEPNGGTLYYRIERLSDGTVAEGSVSSDLPAATTGLGARAGRSNGTTALATTIGLSLVYSQTEFG